MKQESFTAWIITNKLPEHWPTSGKMQLKKFLSDILHEADPLNHKKNQVVNIMSNGICCTPKEVIEQAREKQNKIDYVFTLNPEGKHEDGYRNKKQLIQVMEERNLHMHVFTFFFPEEQEHSQGDKMKRAFIIAPKSFCVNISDAEEILQKEVDPGIKINSFAIENKNSVAYKNKKTAIQWFKEADRVLYFSLDNEWNLIICESKEIKNWKAVSDLLSHENERYIFHVYYKTKQEEIEALESLDNKYLESLKNPTTKKTIQKEIEAVKCEHCEQEINLTEDRYIEVKGTISVKQGNRSIYLNAHHKFPSDVKEFGNYVPDSITTKVNQVKKYVGSSYYCEGNKNCLIDYLKS